MTALPALSGGLAAFATAVLLLRAACRSVPGGRRIGLTLGGWMLLAAGVGLWSLTGGLDLELSLAALAASLLGYLVVAASIKVRARKARAAKERHVANDPLARPSRPWRIGARLLLAGPLSFLFGLTVCAVIAARAPAAEVNALILGGLLAPLAFAGAMIWSLADERLTRVAAGLGAAVLAMGLAAWRP